MCKSPLLNRENRERIKIAQGDKVARGNFAQRVNFARQVIFAVKNKHKKNLKKLKVKLKKKATNRG